MPMSSMFLERGRQLARPTQTARTLDGLLDHRRLPDSLKEREHSTQGLKFADDGTVADIGVNMLDWWATMKGICAHVSTWCKKLRLIVNCNPNKTEVLALFCTDG